MIEHLPNPVQFGLFVTPLRDDLNRVHELTQAAEARGFDYISIQDHPYESTFLDSLALIGVLIGQTRRLRFMSNVANMPLRPPAMLAKTGDLVPPGRRLHTESASGSARAANACSAWLAAPRTAGSLR